jgi:NAD(P)-dependent dehydrogenase (short-subunit alcohol dehydrogenase family)
MISFMRTSEQRRFQGKTALVTGGGSGIGRAVSTRLAGEGAEVIILELTESAAEETVPSASLGCIGE